MQKLTPKQQFMVDQVAATMAVEDMPLTDQAHQNLIDVATGRKTTDEIAAEITKRYRQ